MVGQAAAEVDEDDRPGAGLDGERAVGVGEFGRLGLARLEGEQAGEGQAGSADPAGSADLVGSSMVLTPQVRYLRLIR